MPGATAREMLDGIVAALTADAGPGLRAADAAREEIWTYERRTDDGS
ncbi:hypothetical protein L1785_20490 [Antribacter sp. KLBMP9083]|uniref:Uncharacterized protein n=1 Tax=Antribacter soli TaxID=2910976 RepID=A0AA41QH40_9MICO|nr:hypothetical protein [Antribacter soli]MCF4123349.1 hypothetical protein [Antribacter soli]